MFPENSPSSDGPWDVDFRDSLESVRRASRYSRVVIFALLTFTLAMLIAHLNSWPRGWTKQRIKMVRQALREDCPTGYEDKTPRIGDNAWNNKYAKDRGFLNNYELYRHFEALKSFYNEDILILRIPIVGIRIDANWSTVLTSTGILLLLAALVAAFAREERTLGLNESEEIKRRAIAENFFPRWIATLVIWVPVLMTLWGYLHDVLTIQYGQDIDSVLSRTTNTAGSFLAIACFVAACVATKALVSLDRKRGRTPGIFGALWWVIKWPTTFLRETTTPPGGMGCL